MRLHSATGCVHCSSFQYVINSKQIFKFGIIFCKCFQFGVVGANLPNAEELQRVKFLMLLQSWWKTDKV